MTLLKGISGAGKSAILSLPTLVLYGRLMSVTKSGIANRINKHGWIRGTIVKGQDTFVIEREFAPNSLTIWKNDVQLDHFGSSDAEDYIQTEILDFPIPLNTFSNMICISMKNFKSFLSMSPTDRKKLMDELFDVSIIMAVAESLKSDAKELGNSINGDNGTLFSLNQTLGNSQKELAQIQLKIAKETAENSTPESLDKIEQNNKQIETLNSQMAQYNEAMKTVAEKQQENRNAIDAKNREITENSMVLRQIQEKINLFSQSKCPTCGTPFTGDIFEEARKKLIDIYLPDVVELSKLYVDHGIPMEDLIGEGNIALMLGVSMLECVESVEDVEGHIGKIIIEALEKLVCEEDSEEDLIVKLGAQLKKTAKAADVVGIVEGD